MNRFMEMRICGQNPVEFVRTSFGIALAIFLIWFHECGHTLDDTPEPDQTENISE